MAVLYGDANLYVLSGCRPRLKAFLSASRLPRAAFYARFAAGRHPTTPLAADSLPVEHIMSCPINLPLGYVRLTDAPQRYVVYGLAED